MRFIPYQRDNHAVEVEEEHEEVKAEFDEGFLDRYVSAAVSTISVTSLCTETLPREMRGRKHTRLCTFSFLKISVASRRC